jgi:hypothetical protein
MRHVLASYMSIVTHKSSYVLLANSMKYKLKEFNRDTPESELLNDLKKVSERLGTDRISSRQYDENGGKYSSGTVATRLGGWNKALEKAGLSLVQQREVSEQELFKNMEDLWINIGTQPVFRNIKPPLSKYSSHQYVTKFGTWRKALIAFVEFINSDVEVAEENSIEETVQKIEPVIKHVTKRLPSERLKVQVLMRDGNICRLCGITVTGEDIHFDHIFPWSKGGETVLDNLQILCKKHNLAKGNLEYDTKNT